MENRIETKKGLRGLGNDLKGIVEEYENLLFMLEQIDPLLQEPEWSGKAHEKCITIHELVKKYTLVIAEMAEEMQQHGVELEENADTFHSNSEQVTKVKSLSFWG